MCMIRSTGLIPVAPAIRMSVAYLDSIALS